jgi:hypothetical protein
MANPIPGTTVPIGKAVTPSGGKGLQGPTGPAGAGGAAGAAGPVTVSTDAQNQSKLGTDSGLWAPPKIGKYRYYYCWHFDHPLDGNFLTGVGTGSTVAPSAPTEAGHPGQIKLNQVAGGSPCWIGSGAVADIQLSFFSKFAIRFVTKCPTLNYGIGGTTGYVMVGLVDTKGTISIPNQVNIYYESSGGSTQLYCTRASTSSSVSVSGVLGGGGWVDTAIYWNGTNVYARSGAYTGSPPSTLYGPISTNIPNTANLFWQVALIDGTTGSASLLLDLIEICGELATPGGFRGEDLITNF